MANPTVAAAVAGSADFDHFHKEEIMNIEELMQDDAFRESVEKAESMGELADLLRTQGIDVDIEGLEAMLMEEKAGELDESSLESVAGGSWLSSLKHRIAALRYKAGGGGFSRGGGGKGSFGGADEATSGGR